jgi:putative membrane protein
MKKITHSSFCLPAILLVAALSATATAQTDTMSPPSTTDTTKGTILKHSDSSFIEKAAKSGMEEVQISQIALTRATDPQVKEFAQMMVSDHGSANTKLAQLASSKGVTLPMNEPSEHKWTAKKEGKDFDEDYIGKMVEDHQDAVKLFEKGMKSQDAEVAAFASATLPTLQAHLTQAKGLKKSLK